MPDGYTRYAFWRIPSVHAILTSRVNVRRVTTTDLKSVEVPRSLFRPGLAPVPAGFRQARCPAFSPKGVQEA